MTKLTPAKYLLLNLTLGFAAYLKRQMHWCMYILCLSNLINGGWTSFCYTNAWIIGMVLVHAFLICNVFFSDMNVGKVSLKEWILRTKFWVNTYMTKMLMKFPPCIVKILREILKIAKPHEKSLIITLFKLLKDILIQNSMIKSHSSTGVSSIYMLPTQKHYMFLKMAVDGST